MKIVQNFSSKKHIKRLPLFDIMIWYVGLTHYKQLGYTTKLYCEKKDFPFLKKWGLYDLYDEIDTKFLPTLKDDQRFIKINGTNFWSVRKLFCIENEFKVSKEPFIYSDTDIILIKKIYLPDEADILAWTVEHENIYIDWENMSVPPDYIMPDFMKDVYEAFNCGLMWFKDYPRFNEYFNEYLKFTSLNPCILADNVTEDATTVKNIWACNAEQRILTAMATKNDWNVILFMVKSDIGIDGFSPNGIHYYLLRGALRQTAGKNNGEFWLGFLSNQVKYLLDEIKETNIDLFNQFMVEKELSDLYNDDITLTHYI